MSLVSNSSRCKRKLVDRDGMFTLIKKLTNSKQKCKAILHGENSVLKQDEITSPSTSTSPTSSLRDSSNPKSESKSIFSQLMDPVCVGHGSFSVVYKGYYNGSMMAVKYPRPSVWEKDQKMARFRASVEASLLQKIKHKNVIEFYGYHLEGEDEKPVILTEMVVGYTLRSALTRPEVAKYITPGTKIQILLDLCSVVAHLHSLSPKIVHKDLKSENVLVDLNCNVKICDFADAEEIDTHAKRYTATTWLWGPPELVINFMTGAKINMDECK